MCSVCEQLGMDIHAEAGADGGGGGDPQFAGAPSFTVAQAAAYLNRSEASWEQVDGSPHLGTPTALTYAFRNTDADFRDPAEGAFSRFNANQISIAQLALQSWADVANITFSRRAGEGPSSAYSDNATILFGNSGGGTGAAWGAYAYLPEKAARGAGSHEGDVFVNSSIGANTNPHLFEYGMQALVHELGHAIGFDHPGDYNAGSGGPITYSGDAEFKQDTLQYTVMSYFSETNTGADYDGWYPSAPQMIDIAAVQRLYGANMNFHTGDTTYGFNSNASRVWYEAPADHAAIFCAWDAGGTDTFDFSGYDVRQTIDLRNGFFSSVGGMTFNVSVAAGVKVDGEIVNYIENGIGGSNKDTVIGNGTDNVLEGRGGGDTLSAGKGDDSLLGGDGDDQLVLGKGNDVGIGGLGRDIMTGQKGNDRFVFQSIDDSMVGLEDRIYGGLDRLDRIDVSGIDADSSAGGNQAFHLGGASFDHEAGELIRFYHAGSNTTFVQGDTDGDGDADFSIAVTGNYASFAGFVL